MLNCFVSETVIIHNDFSILDELKQSFIIKTNCSQIKRIKAGKPYHKPSPHNSNNTTISIV